jgi:hypothetical protein
MAGAVGASMRAQHAAYVVFGIPTRRATCDLLHRNIALEPIMLSTLLALFVALASLQALFVVKLADRMSDDAGVATGTRAFEASGHHARAA